MALLWPYSAVLLTVISWAESFNLDIDSRVVHRGAPGSMFGYAVDMYKHNRETWLLVGAPLFQSAVSSVNKGGGVFRCSTTEVQCVPIEFDRLGSTHYTTATVARRDTTGLNGSEPVYVDKKELQWFGATVVASRTKDYVVACAPHYKYLFSNFLPDPAGIEPIGRCILARDGFSVFKEFKPCESHKLWGYHRLGYCMAGFSAALPKESDRLYMGGPGSWYWHGSVFSQNVNVVSDVKRTNAASSATLDDTYVGYSLASGDFNGDGIDDVAAGVPRGDQLKGMVALFDKFLGPIRNISGEQTGSYFGAAIAVGDIDGDNRDDLIIGAPLFSNYEKSTAEKQTTGLYDVGRVYVFFQGPKRTFSKSASVTGDQQSARFGQSVAFVGDLNRDGFNDFVVGAPYAGVNRRGAVFVYHGMKGGMRDKHYQVIFAEEADSGLSTFGFSVSGGRDVDDNEYPDILVGSHRSDRVVMFKSRPIITVTGDIKIHPKEINLDDQNCDLNTPGRPRERVPCALLTFCLEFKGRAAPRSQQINVVITLDTKKGGRSYFLASDRKTQWKTEKTYIQGEKVCDTQKIYVVNEIRDKLTPIVVEANYTLFENRPQRGSQLRPILDAYEPEVIRGKMDILKDCGTDNVCIPDLKLSSQILMCNSSTSGAPTCLERESFRIGSKEHISLVVTVANGREDSFESHLYLTIPVGLDYSRFIRLSQDFPVVCTAPKDYTTHDKTLPYTVDCEIGNPLPKGKTVKLGFEMTTDNLDTSVAAISLNLTVNSTNPEDNSTLTDNTLDIVVPLQIDAKLYLSGTSRPESITYDPQDRLPENEIKLESDIGPNVTHVYQVINDGTSELSKIDLVVVWPTKTTHGSELLYLTKKPRLSGNIKCEPISVNPRQIAPDNPRLIRDVSRKQRDSAANVQEETAFRGFVNKVKQLGNKLEGRFGERTLDINCSYMNCLKISCTVGPLKAGETAEIVIESRLWINTLFDESYYDATISSVAMAQILEVPYKVAGFSHPGQSAVVTTQVIPKDSLLAPRGIPWWLILIAVLAGVAFLILLILLLWKLGFFKRQRAPSTQASRSKPPEGDYYGYSYSGVPSGPGHGARI